MRKLSYMIKDGKVTIRTDHKPFLEMVKGTAKAQNTVAANKFCCWNSDILAGDPHPTIQYKRVSLKVIVDSLLKLRTGEHYEHITPLHNTEPIILKKIGRSKYGHHSCQISRTGTVDPKTTGPANKGKGHF